MGPLRLHSSLGSEAGLYGWGVVTRELHREFARRCEFEAVLPDTPDLAGKQIDGHVLVVAAGQMETYCPLRGAFNYAMGMFDHELLPEAREKAAAFDLVFTGSRWCAGHLRQAGISQAVPFLQGVDTALFSPDPAADLMVGAPSERPFLVFSGGKLEHRKGHDLTIAAMRILQERYPDIILVTVWGNYLGAPSIRSLAASPHIRFAWEEGVSDPAGRDLCLLNGLDPARVICCGPLSHPDLAAVYRRCHLGLFPSRCEAATNMVMCEFMACGRPVVASGHYGHADVLGPDYAFVLEPRHHLGTLQAEVSVEEIVQAVELAYHHRSTLPAIGARARSAMERLTWADAAETILAAMRRVEAERG